MENAKERILKRRIEKGKANYDEYGNLIGVNRSFGFDTEIAPREAHSPLSSTTEATQAATTTDPETYSWDDFDREFTYEPEVTESEEEPETAISAPESASVTTEAGKRVVNYLMQKYGLSEASAIGAAKVFKAESGMIPGRRNKDELKAFGDTKAGIGLAQWSNDRRQDYQRYMDEHGYTNPTVENELDFFIQEAKTRPAFWQAFTNAQTYKDAVDAMYYGFENGGRNAMQTREGIIATYTPAYKRLGYRKFDINKILNARYNAQI